MARNEEKAQSMLNRYLAGKRAEDAASSGRAKRRPFLASECDDLAEADRWRHQVLREVGRKVMEIQNAGLGASQLMDLNDEINKLLREKTHWERRIVELGGPDFSKTAPGAAGGQLPAASKGPGYVYFGAAKDLPGVKELFATGGGGGAEGARGAARRRPWAETRRRLDATYFGFRDEDDGVLLELEKRAEPDRKKAVLEEWWKRHRNDAQADADGRGGAFHGFERESESERAPHGFEQESESERAPHDADQEPEPGRAPRGPDQEPEPGRAPHDASPPASAALAPPLDPLSSSFVAHVPLPSESEIKAKVLEAKKKALLGKLGA